MAKRKAAALIGALLCIVLVLSACGAGNAGIITPLREDTVTSLEAAVFENAGISVRAADASQQSAFAYRWKEPITSIRVWADLYRDGQIISDPVEIRMDDVKAESGTIGFFTEELNDEHQSFALFLSNGDGPGARAQVATGTAELGAAMAPTSRVTLQDAQVTELGETNVLLVMHDGPNLDTEMTNTVNETEQLIASSTYTLVLNCMFT